MAEMSGAGTTNNPLAIPEVFANVLGDVSGGKGRGLASSASVCRTWSDIWSYVTFDTFAELLIGDTLTKFIVKEDGRIVSRSQFQRFISPERNLLGP